MSRQYTQGRPQQEVRLRNWSAGRVAQIRTAIERLEGILNQSAASQISQPEKRELNTRVPLITDLTMRAGFRSFQATFTDPIGIEDLLFYELQHATDSGFSDATTVKSAIPAITMSNITPGETRFFRVRAVNSKFQAGPWSAISQATAAALRIETTRYANTEATVDIATQLDTWVTIGTFNLSPIGGQAAVVAHMGFLIPPRPVTNGFTTVTADVRIAKDGVQKQIGRICGQSRLNAPLSQTEANVFGTLVTPFEELSTAATVYTVQVKIISAESFFLESNVDGKVEYFSITELAGDV
jgi:hypothetical protein